MLFMIAFGIASIVCLTIAWNSFSSDYDYYYYDDDYDYVYYNITYEVVGLACGACFLVAAITAYPLTYKGARHYMKERNSTGVKGLMIAAWVFYGILIVSTIGMIAVGAFWYFFFGYALIGPGWVTGEVIWAIVGWIMMFVHAEKARKSPAKSSPEHPDTWVTENVNFNQDGTQPRKTTKYTKNPDGSINVVTTDEEMEVVDF